MIAKMLMIRLLCYGALQAIAIDAKDGLLPVDPPTITTTPLGLNVDMGNTLICTTAGYTVSTSDIQACSTVSACIHGVLNGVA
jgi:hypothetical protein